MKKGHLFCILWGELRSELVQQKSYSGFQNEFQSGKISMVNLHIELKMHAWK